MKQHLDLIRKIAWNYHHSTKIEFDELFSEACLAYLEGLPKYDHTKSKITTFMWHHISNHLRTFIKQTNEQKAPVRYLEEMRFDKALHRHDVFESLNEEAYQIAKIIYATPKPYAGMNKEDALLRLRNVLLAKGWSVNKIYHGIETLCLAFTNK